MKHKPAKKPDPTRKLAEQIAADIFTDGFGRVATRVVMECAGAATGCGWSQDAVANLIDAHIRGKVTL